MSTDAWTVDDLRRALTAADGRDFDGHTAFAEMTPTQRLDALGRMIAVVADLKGLARRKDTGREPASRRGQSAHRDPPARPGTRDTVR